MTYRAKFVNHQGDEVTGRRDFRFPSCALVFLVVRIGTYQR